MNESEGDGSGDERLGAALLAVGEAADPAAALADLWARDPGLAREVAELLEFQERMDASALRPPAPPPPRQVPERLGPFRLGRRVGGGGMGEVYEAVQEPFERT